MTTPAPGCLIALEGVDGCGKTTQARRLSEALGALLTFEPGGTALGKVLRSVVLDPDAPAARPRAEALLMAADRAQHVTEVIRPALASGRWVVSDRFTGSTLAYQGFGRGIALDRLRRLTEWAADGIEPDLSVLIDVRVDVAQQRLAVAAPDRLEGLDAAFFSRVRDGYLALAREDPEHWVVVAGDPPPDDVATAVLAAVAARLGAAARARGGEAGGDPGSPGARR